ncbi:DUF551 domain-containing protein [Clostridium sp. D33t1_170424_F3]|uniref:DUF551 domain-containing protein n=1 Tax=Clostridium sp. D33t1_170424_F3 TaxID=2787099 RepID=UPI0018ABC307|nr:DUF551 domain-containing protein [Clostridium sp. D33t1_170424_F3]
MFRYQKGYIFEGHTFVVEKSDIHNAREEQFVEATALLPDCWISVEEQLPEVPVNRIYGGTGCVGCLVVVEANGPTVLFMEYERATIRGKVAYRWKWRDRISTWKVTHWQYLPEPPVKREQEDDEQ